MEKIVKATAWYDNNKENFYLCGEKIKILVKEFLYINEINYYEIISRIKTKESFCNKAKKIKYKVPENEIKDIIGIRIITYFNNDLRKICEIIEKEFKIFQNDSINKIDTLGTDRVGYRSIHYVGQLSENRTSLSEYQHVKNYVFEIQIRSILQHVWAEIEHDRNYKFKGKLPQNLQRRFAILSGVLELADQEFDSIANEIDIYEKKVSNETRKGHLNIEINSTSLRQYMIKKFEKEIKLGLESIDIDKSIINELNIMGINKLSDLDSIIPNDILLKAKEEIKKTNFVGILRTILMINDFEKYFEKAWQQKWTGIDPESVITLKNYNIEYEVYFRKYDIHIESEDYED